MLIRLSTLFAGLLLATAPARSAAPDPLDGRSATKALQHRSAFDGYRRQGDDPPMGWRQANDAVGRIGGWRAYAREAAASAAPPSPPAAAPASSSEPGRPVAPGRHH